MLSQRRRQLNEIGAASVPFPSIAPSHEPDLAAYLGISLANVKTYSELLHLVRSSGVSFSESTKSEGVLPTPMRCSLLPGSYSSVVSLAFDYDRGKGALHRYNLFLDNEENLLCIENNYGYRNPY
jgi:hypothetical protein